jgi:archaellum component FlaF (FlaF/FlaG flagellin family)
MKPRRGVSEIVASMVVLVIVSVLGVMLYNISMQGLNGQQNNLLSDVGLQEEIAQERFEIVAVTKVNESQWNITFYNYGQVDIKITDVYVESGNTVNHQNLLSPIPCAPAHLNSLIITGDEDVTAFRITSEKGVSIEYHVS